jgi:hypothetical protein
MLQVKSLIRFAVLLLVIVSGILLGLSLGNMRLMLIAIIGATLRISVGRFLQSLSSRRHPRERIASVGILDAGDAGLPSRGQHGQAAFRCQSAGLPADGADVPIENAPLDLADSRTEPASGRRGGHFQPRFRGWYISFSLYFVIAGATLVLQAIYSINFETTQRNHQQVITKFGHSRQPKLVESKTNAETG